MPGTLPALWSTIISKPFRKTVWLNDYGADYTGAVAADTAWGLAKASGATRIIFEGVYRFVQNIEPSANTVLDLRSGTDIRLYGVAANSTKGFIELLAGCRIESQPLTLISRPAGEVAAYIGVRALSIYDWGVYGPVKITGFGNCAIKVSGAGTGTNQYRNGQIVGCDCSNQVNQGSTPNGTGIYLLNAAEYVFIDGVTCNENTGFGILNDVAANCPIRNSKIMKNTLGGVKIIGSAGNSDHFDLTGNTINHNEAAGTFNVWITAVDTGVNISGGSIAGGVPFKVESSLGVSFNGVGMAALGTGVYPVITSSTVNINGGHLLGATRAQLLAGFTGGGTLNLNNVAEST